MISIVIPAYNEEKRIRGSLLKTCAYMSDSGMEYEIIVVDDGSSDGTSRIVESMAADSPKVRLVRYEKNRGKGHALRTGALVAKGDFVLVMDADLSTPMEELARPLFGELKINRFAYDVEILARALRKGFRIQEVPIRWINSPESRVDPLKDSLQMLADLVRIRYAVGKVSGKRVRQGLGST
jgi:dolichyl-phosphate beta-glucosyltransferase